MVAIFGHIIRIKWDVALNALADVAYEVCLLHICDSIEGKRACIWLSVYYTTTDCKELDIIVHATFIVHTRAKI